MMTTRITTPMPDVDRKVVGAALVAAIGPKLNAAVFTLIHNAFVNDDIRRDKIPAIKLVRETFHIDLVSAKTLVDTVWAGKLAEMVPSLDIRFEIPKELPLSPSDKAAVTHLRVMHRGEIVGRLYFEQDEDGEHFYFETVTLGDIALGGGTLREAMVELYRLAPNANLTWGGTGGLSDALDQLDIDAAEELSL